MFTGWRQQWPVCHLLRLVESHGELFPCVLYNIWVVKSPWRRDLAYHFPLLLPLLIPLIYTVLGSLEQCWNASFCEDCMLCCFLLSGVHLKSHLCLCPLPASEFLLIYPFSKGWVLHSKLTLQPPDFYGSRASSPAWPLRHKVSGLCSPHVSFCTTILL